PAVAFCRTEFGTRIPAAVAALPATTKRRREMWLDTKLSPRSVDLLTAKRTPSTKPDVSVM
ncbi:MAG: hypothetical protein WCL20_08235, partial [Actinomycetes bacterium]